MNENAYRVRAERGHVQIGTWVTMIRTPAIRSSYATIAEESRRSAPANR